MPQVKFRRDLQVWLDMGALSSVMHNYDLLLFCKYRSRILSAHQLNLVIICQSEYRDAVLHIACAIEPTWCSILTILALHFSLRIYKHVYWPLSVMCLHHDWLEFSTVICLLGVMQAFWHCMNALSRLLPCQAWSCALIKDTFVHLASFGPISRKTWFRIIADYHHCRAQRLPGLLSLCV